MKFQMEDVTVYFPYDHIYPEQYAYMVELKRALDAEGHCLLEMPTGTTGKTIALLSLITAYILSKPQNQNSVKKLIYCTRTVHEMEKTVAELKLLHRYQVEQHLGGKQVLAVGLSSRKNLCINHNISWPLAGNRLPAGSARTRTLTLTCPPVSVLGSLRREQWTCLLLGSIACRINLRAVGKTRGWCPYFLARKMVEAANVVVCTYQYMLDPKLAGIISKNFHKESVVVFDEAHSIDNACIEALSVSVRRQTLQGAIRNLSKMQQEIEILKATDAGRLHQEYNNLVEGLKPTNLPIMDANWLRNPALPNDVLKEPVPGNIRKPEHFLHVLQRLVHYLEGCLKTAENSNVEREVLVGFVNLISIRAGIDHKTLKFCYDRLHSLMMTLGIIDIDEFLPIQTICNFATLVGTYAGRGGFSIIFEPTFDERSIQHDIPADPVLHLSCHDASLAIKPVFDRFQSVVITSGTLSPIDIYPRLLSFNPAVIRSFTMSLTTEECICPMVLTRGSDQLPFDMMTSDIGGSVVRNYGRLLLEMVSIVPDGVVCFFGSYSHMDGIVNSWNQSGILKEIMQHKLVFIETLDVVETTLALDSYRKACDSGRGAVFFSVAAGKVAQGIDFDRHYGRLVIIYGLPNFQYKMVNSNILLARLEYLRNALNIKEEDFLAFDALRQVAQCVGRVVRSKTDYSMMIFADKMYSRRDKRSRLMPGWILSHLPDARLNLSTDMALHVAHDFLKKMAQPYDKAGSSSKALLSHQELEMMR